MVGGRLASKRASKLARELEKSCIGKDAPTLFNWARGIKPKRVEVIKRWNILEGDKVAVVNGKCEGQRGTVKTILRQKNLAIVDGVNLRYRMVDDEANPQGERLRMKIPCVIHYSNINLICPLTNLPTRVRHRWVGNERIRFAARSGAEIPKPELKIEKKAELIGDKDTEQDDVTNVTYDALKERGFWANGWQNGKRVLFDEQL